LPDTWAGIDLCHRIGRQVTGRPTVGASLVSALERNGLVTTFLVDENDRPIPDGDHRLPVTWNDRTGEAFNAAGVEVNPHGFSRRYRKTSSSLMPESPDSSVILTMPEIPDFDQIAMDLLVQTDGDLGVTEVAEELRQVWNARGAADLAKLEWAFDPAVSNGQPSMKLLDQVLRTLDR